MVSPKHIRKADFNERYYICRCTEGYSTNFSITVKYNKPVSRNLLSNALRSMLIKNSWLLHNFFKTDDQDDSKSNGHNWIVRIIESVQFKDVVKYEKIDLFDENIMEKVNLKMLTMNVDLPLWRIIVFEEKNYDQLICVYVDHSHFDGLSGVQFQKDLSKELANGKEDNFTEELFNYKIDYMKLPDIMPSSESVTDLYYPSYYQIIKHYLSALPLYSRLTNLFSSSNDPPVFHTDSPINKDLTTKFKIIKYSSDQVDQITKFCRYHGITLTTYFNIICLKALEEEVFKSSFSTSSLVAINGRRYYSDDIKNFRYGSMVCGDNIVLKPITNILKSMQQFHKTMMENIGSRCSFKLVGMYNYINIWEYFRSKIGKIGGRFTLTISNLGKIANSNQDFIFKEMYFCSNTGVVYNFILNMTTLPNNELTAVFGYLPEFEPNVGQFLSRFHSLSTSFSSSSSDIFSKS